MFQALVTTPTTTEKETVSDTEKVTETTPEKEQTEDNATEENNTIIENTENNTKKEKISFFAKYIASKIKKLVSNPKKWQKIRI